MVIISNIDKMKNAFVFSLCQFIIIEYIRVGSTEIPNTVNFNIISERNEEIQLKLVRTETFLANENLPVWVANEEFPTVLTSLSTIMTEITPFTVYRDPSNCAAALYFHKLGQFDGTVGHNYIIRKLKYNPVTKTVEPTEDTILSSSLMKHDEIRLAETEGAMFDKDQQQKNGHKSLGKYPDTVYVETIVLIDYLVAKSLEFDQVSIVSYVLTIFNSVDMLYSPIEIPKIKINIAGIIIGWSKHSFPKLIELDCYKERPTDQEVIAMDALCAARAIQHTLKSYRSIPFQSYDIAVFLSKPPLFVKKSVTTNDGAKKTIHTPLEGLAVAPYNTNGYRLSFAHLRVAVVSYPDIFSHFAAAAHEMAHLFGAPHDSGALWKEDGSCDAHLMKTDDSYCKKCFRFGGKTPEYLKMFFSTRDACIFQNEPRSLKSPPGPRAFWNENEQCKCYGYTSAYKPVKNLCENIAGWFHPTVHCETRLKCVDENGVVDETTFYLDGTPCDRNERGTKVCWNQKCSVALKDHVRQRNN